MSEINMTFKDAVRLRHSPRDFLPTPLSNEQLQAVLLDAQYAPSNCNTQPWHVHIVSGATKDKLVAAMLSDSDNENYSPDFSFANADFTGVYSERQQAQGKCYHEALGIARDDKDARVKSFRRNLEFFNAPHAAFLFMPSVGDNVRVAGDIGMYAQNFLLSLAAQGLAGIPQTVLGFFANSVREILGVSDEYKLLFGISFGYEDPDAPSQKIRMDRAPVSDCVTIHP